MIAPALVLVAAISDGARLVARPRSRVLHVYAGPLTPGGSVPAARRGLCGARTRRLKVVAAASREISLGVRRLCLRCESALAKAGSPSLPTKREQIAKSYAALTPALVQWAGLNARTSAESHQVGRAATILFGEKPQIPPSRRTPAEAELVAMYEAIYARRRNREADERSPEEQAKRDLMAEAKRDLAQCIAAQRSKDAQRNRAIDRRARSQYPTPHERDLLASA